jgi:hypothetical protein
MALQDDCAIGSLGPLISNGLPLSGVCIDPSIDSSIGSPHIHEHAGVKLERCTTAMLSDGAIKYGMTITRPSSTTSA